MDFQDKKELTALENDLVSRFRGGEADAFARLLELYKDRVHQFILCILGPDREAEDLAQEVFIQIHNSLANFRGESSFSTWAFSLTRNICRRRLRDRGRESGLFAEQDEERELPDKAPSAETAFEREEDGRRVRAAVDGLSPLHRSVLFLSCWEQLSYAEIAAALDIPVGTVRSRIHNAMAALALKLKPALEVNENELPV